ncbi:hypothetical protein M433DRAFT_154135 [Acidomyces richmondensis BFW]|nr:MAG: hypothetical protein FE78DRAFT_90075 [Acidomyces sp. 'richmondensis']KYG45788.1 hypothetical protein M433DRAFT_154135 [Acidomyces richmondensis BFW]
MFPLTLLVLPALIPLSLSFPNPQAESSGPIVTLPGPDHVSIRGTSANGTDSFLNIRFGASTAGSNRFAPPKPYTYPAGITVDATRPGAACPQQKVPVPDFPIFANVSHISEDCLSLRIDRPSHTRPDARLPVLVFIYGGGDSIGQIYDPVYDPTALVASSAAKHEPVIYAAMNYRLGIFGFAASPALRAQDALNAGLRDQRLALEWLRRHIAAFGGDPENMTIFGESDGATGVGLQITAYGGDDHIHGAVPFRRAIMESGGPTADPGVASNYSATHTAQLAARVNCTAVDNEVELACLRALPLDVLLREAVAYEREIDPLTFDVFIPTAPSSFIPASPSELLYAGRFAHNIDIIAGWNEDDGSFFTPTNLTSNAEVAAFLLATIPAISDQTIEKALALYPVAAFASSPGASNSSTLSPQFFRASRMLRDMQFTCPNLLVVQAMINHSLSANTPTMTYLYDLNQTLFAAAFAAEDVQYYGVSHFSDIPYIFDLVAESAGYAALASAEDVRLSEEMSGSWAAFAGAGNPAGGNRTVGAWPVAAPRGEGEGVGEYRVRILGGPRAGVVELRGYEEVVERCEFWNSREVLREIRT